MSVTDFTRDFEDASSAADRVVNELSNLHDHLTDRDSRIEELEAELETANNRIEELESQL